MAARLKLAALSVDRSVTHVDYDPVVIAHAMLLIFVMHFVPDAERPHDVVRRLMEFRRRPATRDR